MECISGEDAVNIIEMAEENLEYYVNLADRAAIGSDRTDFSFHCIVDKMLSRASHAREVFCERKTWTRYQLYCLILRNWHSHPSL
jgi:hypothetical protein